MQETWVHSLCQEDSLEEEVATYSSILYSLFMYFFMITVLHREKKP